MQYQRDSRYDTHTHTHVSTGVHISVPDTRSMDYVYILSYLKYSWRVRYLLYDNYVVYMMNDMRNKYIHDLYDMHITHDICI